MLVLSRKYGESIVISDNITITVVEIQGNRVRLGIHAPRDVVINRQEVHDAIQAKKAAEATTITAEINLPKIDLVNQDTIPDAV